MRDPIRSATYRGWPRALALIVALLPGAALAQSARPAAGPAPATLTGEVRYAGGRLHVAWKPGDFAFSAAELLEWIEQSARAVTLYFGRFPVRTATLAIEPVTRAILSRGSATSGPEPQIVLHLARDTTAAALRRETVLVHEMTHLAMPALDMRHIWLQEGIATYVEFVARAQAGLMSPEAVWARFVRDMPLGLPQARDAGGLDSSLTAGRRYWGGALFCLLADIEIRKATGNRLGLQDALRAVQSEGGDLTRAWDLEHVLSVADRSNTQGVMKALYRTHGQRGMTVSLPDLWRQLGVHSENGRLWLEDAAPLADIRRAITGSPSAPLLLAEPRLVRDATQERRAMLP